MYCIYTLLHWRLLLAFSGDESLKGCCGIELGNCTAVNRDLSLLRLGPAARQTLCGLTPSSSASEARKALVIAVVVPSTSNIAATTQSHCGPSCDWGGAASEKEYGKQYTFFVSKEHR